MDRDGPRKIKSPGLHDLDTRSSRRLSAARRRSTDPVDPTARAPFDPTIQEMLDDIWRAHEHGWLPLSMTEKSQSEMRWTAPRTWFRKQITYVVTYRNGHR